MFHKFYKQNRIITFVLLLFSVSCSSAQPVSDVMSSLNYDILSSHSVVDYERDVQPILDHRCVICHGCFDAPCQLKLESYEGVQRGASKLPVYGTNRLLAADPTRLFEDAVSRDQWRNKGFFPVLNETPLAVSTAPSSATGTAGANLRVTRESEADDNVRNSLLARFLILKQEHPQPETPRLPAAVNLDLDRGAMCPTMAEFDAVKTGFPLWGMPYALPQLPQWEFRTLMQWIRNGSPGGKSVPQSAETMPLMIGAWEAYLNGDSLKEQLVAQYIYEHVFLANIYFEDFDTYADRPKFYNLVRSRTAAPAPVDRIVTRRPFDDPGVSRVYYRLIPVQETIIAKRHLPLLLDQDRLNRYRELFSDAAYEVTQLPGYEVRRAANPFSVFADLPVRARYQFMLEDAHFYINGFIKGPVCRGQVALDVINDRFWVVFVDPENGVSDHEDAFLRAQAKNLIMPASDGDAVLPFVDWWQYARAHSRYLTARVALRAETWPSGLDQIWDGGSKNTNAALTVFRHFDSATVVRGFVGETPKTAWVLDYPLLERIHYLLVAGFDVFGNVGHKLHTRLYMDFLRLEGEMNFVSLLPKNIRTIEWEYWYRDAQDQLTEYLEVNQALWRQEPRVEYDTLAPKAELLSQIRDHLDRSVSRKYVLSESAHDNDVIEALGSLSNAPVTAINLLPETTYLVVISKGEDSKLFTLLHNAGHSNIAQMFSEEERRLPSEDSLTVANGLVGSYPNSLLQVPQQRLKSFVEEFNSLKNEKGYRVLLDQYGIRRTDRRFWDYIDDLDARYRRTQPVEAGILDFNRLENR